MNVVITDLIPDGTCELTGKAGVECVRTRLKDGTPEAVIGTASFFRLVRFQRAQQDKQAPPRPSQGA